MRSRLPAAAAAIVLLPVALALAQAPPSSNGSPPPSAPDSAAKTIFYASQQNANDMLASNFLNHPVYGPKDEKLGKITDLIIDGEGEAVAVIVGVGGFLGIGEKDVAITFKALTPKTKNGSSYLTIDVTKEALKNAPKFTKLARQM
jgi:hypothetical protein